LDKTPDELALLDQQREPSNHIRLLLLNILQCLCVDRPGRDALRNKHIYPVLRGMHMEEPPEDVSEAIESIVDLIMRDETGMPDHATTPADELINR
jgi:hypothetical protein